jgi:aminoglycoside N3'-acetyltransferase
MLDSLISIIKYITPEKLKKSIRKYKRFFKRRSLKKNRESLNRLTIEEFRNIIENKLKIKKGDTIIVHSSFGNLYAGFSPEEAVKCLMSVITENGNIIMPYYPTGHAYHWLKNNNVFDPFSSKSRMGILTQTFSEFRDVKISPHPVKAVAAWGKDRDFLISEHHKSLYPYDEKSPYYKTLSFNNSKTVGLGIEINSFFHSCEDIFWKDKGKIYSKKVFDGKFKTYEGKTIIVKTYAHVPTKIQNLISNCEFLKRTKCPSYLRFENDKCAFYSVVNQAVLQHSKEQFANNIDRILLSKQN